MHSLKLLPTIFFDICTGIFFFFDNHLNPLAADSTAYRSDYFPARQLADLVGLPHDLCFKTQPLADSVGSVAIDLAASLQPFKTEPALIPSP